jgi:hypothetical protein
VRNSARPRATRGKRGRLGDSRWRQQLRGEKLPVPF